MVRLLLALSFVLACVLVGMVWGPQILEYKGYVLITHGLWKIELTIFSLVLFIGLTYFLIWFSLRIVATLLAMGNWSVSFLSAFGERKQRNTFRKGMLAYYAGDFAQAQKALGSVKPVLFDGLPLLALASIKQQQNDTTKQCEYLTQAQSIEESQVAATFALTQMALATHNFPLAQQYIDSLAAEQQMLPQAIKAKAQILASAGKWRELQQNLPQWKKQLPKADFQKLNTQTELNLYAEIASKSGANELKQAWEQQPRKIKKDLAHQVAFVSQLLQQGFHQDAEAYLVDWQPKQFVPELLPLMAEIKLQRPTLAIKKVESWLKQDTENTELLALLGKLAFTSGDLDLAERVLQKRLQLGDAKADRLLLAKIKEAKQDTAGALELYKLDVTS